MNVDIRTLTLSRMNFYRLSLGFSQYEYHCHKLVRLSQACGGMVKILQGCDKLVTNITLWLQSCNELVKLLHGCDKLVTTL